MHIKMQPYTFIQTHSIAVFTEQLLISLLVNNLIKQKRNKTNSVVHAP